MSVIFSANNVCKSFDGVQALSRFSLNVNTGDILGLFGPNGAGKTTFFNIATGFLPLDEGRLAHGVNELVGLEPFQIVNLGIARTFQNMRLIQLASILENVLLYCRKNPSESLRNLFLRPSLCRVAETAAREKCLALLAEVGLEAMPEEPAGNLSYGQQKLLSIICCLASEASLLLLDEPVAGIAPNMANTIMDIIKQLPGKGITVIVIEHNMDVLRKICTRLVFMDAGRKICEGSPLEVLNDPRVLAAYLD